MRLSFKYLVLFFLLPGFQSFSQDKIALPSTKAKQVFYLQQGAIFGEVSIDALELTVDPVNKDFFSVAVDQFFPGGRPGEPSLPVFNSLVQLLPGVEYKLFIDSMDSVEIDLDLYPQYRKLLPFSESKLRNIEPSDEILNIDPWIYKSNSYYGLALVDMVEEGRIRGLDIGRVSISPVKYNPYKRKLKVYYHIKFRLEPVSEVIPGPVDFRSSVFKDLLSGVKQVQSYQKKVTSEEPLTLVVLSDSLFREELAAFIHWKRTKGFNVVELYRGQPGPGSTAESIKAYLQGLYDNPPADIAPPSYLLIVGNTSHVPLSSGSGVITDLYYTTFDGPGDYLPDILHGRISVDDEDELNVVLKKLLDYEKYNLEAPAYLDKSLLVAGYDNSYAAIHGNGQINYASDNYINDAHGIEADVFLHPEASVSDGEIRSLISEGYGFINYTGHGDINGWIDPAFRISNIPDLASTNNYSFIISNGCKTNVFSAGSDCFAEALLKVEGKGAIGYIGCTADSYWDEDYFWAVGLGNIVPNPTYASTEAGFYDKAFHDSIEEVGLWASTMADMIFAGNMAVQSSLSQHKEYYWEIYQLMGDPTMTPWFRQPEDALVTYPYNLGAAEEYVDITAGPNDLAAISCAGDLLDAAHADSSGNVSLFIPPDFRGDTLLLVITSDTRKPFIREIPGAGYLEYGTPVLSQESVEQEGMLSPGESASFSMQIINKGLTATAENAKLKLTVEGDVELIDSLVILPVIGVEDTILLEDAFRFTSANHIQNGSQLSWLIERDGENEFNNFRFKSFAVAPDLVVTSFSASDVAGNGNRILEAGEEVLVEISLQNRGSFTSDSIQVHIVEEDSLFDEKLLFTTQALGPDQTGDIQFSLQLPGDLIPGISYKIGMVLDDDSYSSDTLYLVIGSFYEDFSQGISDVVPWQVNDWYIDTANYNSSPAALRSASISHRESSAAVVTIHVSEPDSLSFFYKVSSESGYDFLDFSINGESLAKWSGDLDWRNYTHILDRGVYTLSWTYSKDRSEDGGVDAAWIDDIIFPVNSFVPIDLKLNEIRIDSFGLFGTEENLQLEVGNLGIDSIFDFTVYYQVDEGGWQSEAIHDTLPPLDTILVLLNGILDFSEVRSYELQVATGSNEDTFPWNDSLSINIEHYAFPDLGIETLYLDYSSKALVELYASISNSGNVGISSVDYTVTIDNVYSYNGRSYISLLPGMDSALAFTLIHQYNSWLDTGWHDYRVELFADSLQANNLVTGSVYWSNALGTSGEILFFDIYPNPVANYLVINTGSYSKALYLTLLDINGRILYRKELDSGENILYRDDISKDVPPVVLLYLQDAKGKVFTKRKLVFDP